MTWLELWQHITQDCEAALFLRMALDDQNPGVIAAAASALQALTGSRHWGSELDLPDAGRRAAGVMAERMCAYMISRVAQTLPGSDVSTHCRGMEWV